MTWGKKNKWPECFWNRVKVGHPEECWEWIGKPDSVGYGAMTYQKKSWRSHRLSYVLTYGNNIPKGMSICHRCDNRKCCNPNHLFLGTHQENISDMIQKQRQIKGECVHSCKLTETDVVQIRQMYDKGKVGYIRLSKQFGVNYKTIQAIIRRKTWKHI
jgi:hypothetical protein